MSLNSAQTNQAIGGGPNKIKFKCNQEADEILLESAKIVRENREKPFQATFLNEFERKYDLKIGYPFNGSLNDVKRRLSKLESDNPERKRTNLKWDERLECVLLECGLLAQAMKFRDPTISNTEVLFENFIKNIPEFCGEPNTLRNRFQSILRSITDDILQEKNEIIEEKPTKEELAESKSVDNMPKDLRLIKQYLKAGKDIGEEELFCGML